MNQLNTRIRFLGTFFFAVILLFTGILFHTQYTAEKNKVSKDTAAVASYSVAVPSVRGEILDINGQPLVQNRQGTDIVIYYVTFPEEQEEKNNILLSLIHTAEQNNDEWIDELPLEFGPDGNIRFCEDRESDISFMKSEKMLHLNTYATAQNCLDAFVRDYKLENYTVAEQRKLASVYYNMVKTSFGYLTSYTFAKDVSAETTAFIMEHNIDFKGVDTIVSAYREYNGDGTLAAHILGVVGAIKKSRRCSPRHSRTIR